jgi:hypothetical protein
VNLIADGKCPLFQHIRPKSAAAFDGLVESDPNEAF